MPYEALRPKNPVWMTLREIARLAKVSTPAVHNWINNAPDTIKPLPAQISVNGATRRIRVLNTDLFDWLATYRPYLIDAVFGDGDANEPPPAAFLTDLAE